VATSGRVRTRRARHRWRVLRKAPPVVYGRRHGKRKIRTRPGDCSGGRGRRALGFGRTRDAAEARDERLKRPQAGGKCLGLRLIGDRNERDERRQEALDRKQVFADVEQAVTAASAGQRLDFAEQQGQRIDVPTLVAQPLPALAQHLEALGQMAQERQAQFRRLLGVVLLLHWLRLEAPLWQPTIPARQRPDHSIRGTAGCTIDTNIQIRLVRRPGDRSAGSRACGRAVVTA